MNFHYDRYQSLTPYKYDQMCHCMCLQLRNDSGKLQSDIVQPIIRKVMLKKAHALLAFGNIAAFYSKGIPAGTGLLCCASA